MTRIVITLTLLIVTVSAFFILQSKPNNSVNSSALEQQQGVNELKSINQHSDHLHSDHIHTAHTVDEKLTSNHSSDHSEDGIHVHSPETASNSAAQFDKLPKAMQKEIKQLNGRNKPYSQPVEVEPGVFLIPAGKGVSIVPVAVINDDGTLSIHEY